jgi:signal transduction histidine kinase
MKPLSFRAKLALTMGGLILLISGFISVYFPRKLEQEALALSAHKAETLAQLTAFTIHPALYFEDRAALEEALSGARGDKDVAYVVVIDGSGRPIAEFRPERATPGALTRRAAGGAVSPRRDLFEVMTPILDQGRELARLYIGISLDRLNREILRTRIAMGMTSLLIFAAGLAAVLLISSFLTQPLRQVAASARNIAAGNLDQNVPVGSSDEVGQLASSFNDMATRISERNASLQRSHQQLRELSKRLMSVQEEERTRIAREVHDELGQALTAFKIDLQQLPRTDGVMEEQVRALTRTVDGIIELVRRIATDLRPAVLDDLGITAALEQQLRRLRESTGIRTTLTVSQEPRFDMLSASTVFRIVQESLANVVRHSGATEVCVSLTVNSHEAVLQVRDNGRGITPEQASSARSLGLLGIRERATLLGGSASVEASPQGGTTLTVTLPLAGS